MKLDIVVPDYPPNIYGGTEIFTKDLADNLKNKLSVSVITTGINKDKHVTALPKISKSRILNNIFQICFFTFKLLKSKSDLIVAHMFASSGIAALIVAKIKKKPVILRLSGFEFRFKWPMMPIFLNMLRFYDGIICINSDMKKKILRYNKNIVVFPQGIKGPIMKIKKLNKKPNIIFVGRFVKFKNLKLFLELCKKMPDYNFHLVGDGPDLNLLNSYSLSNLTYYGTLKKNKLFKLLKKMDILVNTSYEEPFGRIFIEAMKFRVPVLARNKGGPKDIIISGRNGYLVKKYTLKEYSKKIKLILKDYDKIQSKIQEEFIKYDWNFLLKKYIKFYKKIYLSK